MTPDLVVDPFEPICNGVHFEDADRLPRIDLLRIMAEGYLFATEFRAGGRCYGGTVLALDEYTAQQLATARGLGERVIGPVAIWRREGRS